MATNVSLKCHFCTSCQGYGCISELPGLGGVFNNQNFQLNCAAWKNLQENAAATGDIDRFSDIFITPSVLRCGPVTGAVENIGYSNEKDFYYPYVKNSASCGIGICIGDGYPDEKLKYGIEAVKTVNSEFAGTKAAFFLKPYPDSKLEERLSWVSPFAEYIGIDIDSYNILTMRNLVHLERKTAEQLNNFRKKFDVPFVIKGVFTDDDIELVKSVQPDVVYISNHGGRVETKIGSSAEFLVKHGSLLKKYCSQIWIDGGIRTKLDIQTALFYGADKVIMARPLIRATAEENFNSFVKTLL